MKRDMNRILVTAIGSFSGDIVIKNLKKAGYYVVGCNIYPQEWTANALEIDSFYQAPAAIDKTQYMDFIYDVCKREKIDFLIPLTDVEVDILNANRNSLLERNVTLCISDEECIKLTRNKYRLYCFLREYEGIRMIPTTLFTEMDMQHINFPVVVKPYDGRSSQGLKYINSIEELEFFRNNNDVSKYILQPKIEGDIITIDIIREPLSNSKVAVCRKELLRTLNGAGTSVYVFCDEELEQKAMNIADYLGVKGTVNFEFIEDRNHQMYFMECNPRFSGGVAFSCMAGYNFVENHINCFKKQSIEQNISVKEMYIARKYEEYITRVCE